MYAKVSLGGPIKADFIFCYISRSFDCKVLPKSPKGSFLPAKYYNTLDHILAEAQQNYAPSEKIYKADGITGNLVLFLILPNDVALTLHDSPTANKFILSLIKVDLAFDAKERRCYVEPLESFNLYPTRASDLFRRYQDFIKSGTIDLPYEGNYGEILIHGCSDSVLTSVNNDVVSYTLAEGFIDTFARQTSPIDIYIHKIWPCGEWANEFELKLLEYESWYNVHKKWTLSHKMIELEGGIVDYLKSDSMVIPDEFSRTKYAKVDSDSDFSNYSDQENSTAESFEFGDPQFFSAISQLKDGISQFNEGVFPYINGSYLQDGIWILNNTNLCHDTRDLLLLIKASTEWQRIESNKLQLFLYEAKLFRKSTQFRVYVYDLEIVVITQLFLNQVYDYLLKEDQRRVFRDRITRFYHEQVQDKILHMKNIVLDVYFADKDEVYLLDIKPWKYHSLTLFSWHNLYEFATCGNNFEACNDSAHVSISDNIAFVVLTSENYSKATYNLHPEDVNEIRQMLIN